MTSKRFSGMCVLALAALGLVCGRAQAQFDSPVEKKWTVQEKDDKGEDERPSVNHDLSVFVEKR